MTLEELRAALVRGDSYKALVRSADPTVYLLQVEPVLEEDQKEGQNQGATQPITLTNARGENLVYRSRSAADQACAQAGFKEVTLVHESAYGEMIGLEPGGDTRLQQTYPVSVDVTAGG